MARQTARPTEPENEPTPAPEEPTAPAEPESPDAEPEDTEPENEADEATDLVLVRGSGGAEFLVDPTEGWVAKQLASRALERVDTD